MEDFNRKRRRALTHLRPFLWGLGGTLAVHGLMEASRGQTRGEARAQAFGNRIKNVVTVSAEGLETPDYNRFYDATWQLDCLFATSEDGVTRCLPWNHGSIYYADEDCTDEVVRISDPCESDTRALRVLAAPAEDPCAETRYRTVELGSDYAGIVYEKTDTGCRANDLNGEYCDVKRYLSPSEWVPVERRPK